MDLKDVFEQEGKLRIIQESVPGKQITIAHIIANPDEIIYRKLGLNPDIDYSRSAIGILTMCPSETAIIAADIAMKSGQVELGFVDRFSGTLITTGNLSEIESSMEAIIKYVEANLGFTVCKVTRM
ncbi:MAG: BMC domain-containing protein [Cellulosilyticaceae bacterium]